MKGGHGVLQYINGEKYEVRWYMFVSLHTSFSLSTASISIAFPDYLSLYYLPRSLLLWYRSLSFGSSVVIVLTYLILSWGCQNKCRSSWLLVIWKSYDTITQGQWLNNFANGTGTLTYADGDKYVGTWKDGKKSESGELYYTNGDKFRWPF